MDWATTPAESGSSKLAVAYRIIVAVVPLLVLIQAFLIGRGIWLGNRDLIDWHQRIADPTVLLALVLAVLAVVRYRRDRSIDTIDLVACIALFVLLFVQLALGYSGTDEDDPSPGAIAWHVPNGVLIAIVGTVLLTRSLPRRA